MYDVILNLCKFFSSLPIVVLIILLVAVNILKLIIAIRQIYIQEACEKSGFAVASRIFSWISFLSIAMYSWSVYYDRDISDKETHFLIIGLIAVAVSFVFGLIAQSLKLSVFNIVIAVVAFFSGSLFGVLLDKWPFFWAIIGVGLLDFAIGGIAHKVGDKAPTAEEIKHQQRVRYINESLNGINKEYFRIYQKDLPKLNEEERLVIAACCDAQATRNYKELLYKRIWLSGTILWYLTRKNKYYPMSGIVSKAHLRDDGKIDWTEEYDPDEAALIDSYSRQLSTEMLGIDDYLNFVIRIIDADEIITAKSNRNEYAYVCDASRRKIGLFNHNIQWTDDYIIERNSDTKDAEAVKLALSDLADFFVGVIDIRYKKTEAEKRLYLKSLPNEKRYVMLYCVVCLNEAEADRLTDASYIHQRIKQLDDMLAELSENQFDWSLLFSSLNTAIENLGGRNVTRFNSILNEWPRYRTAFVAAKKSL